jgi:cAMP-dependent protein kinase regulator
MDDYERS